MHRSRAMIAGLALLALAGCGSSADDPTNPPIKGNWTIETRLNTAQINNMNYGRDAFIAQGGGALINGVEKTDTKTCFEPQIRDDDSLIKTVAGHFLSCKIAESSMNGDQRHAIIQCGRGAQSTRIALDGSIGAEERRVAIVMTVAERKPSGTTQTTTLRLSQTAKRTGDCG